MSSQRLAQFVQPDLPESRIASQWGRVCASEQRSRRRVPGLLLAGAALCVLVVIGLGIWWPRGDRVASGGTVFESSADGASRLSLPDGSQLVLGRGTRVSILDQRPNRTALLLEHGEVELEVAPQPARRFTVQAGAFEVAVVGTHFRVSLAGGAGQGRVGVTVQHGKVEVSRAGSRNDVRTLSAGESWSDGAKSESVGPESVAAEATARPGASADSLAGGTRGGEPAYEPTASASTKPAVVGPKELFEAAEAARLGGRAREAAAALDRLRRTYRKDPRAGLAAFELGRLRMDRLGDPGGAAEALSDALALGLGASFRQDAETRVVQAYDRMGATDRCRAAKAAYLARYPRSDNGRLVGRLCAD